MIITLATPGQQTGLVTAVFAVGYLAFSVPALTAGVATRIGCVVRPADVAALAVHIMTNTALTGATFDIDGGQQLIPGA
jgi:hypothetical protein